MAAVLFAAARGSSGTSCLPFLKLGQGPRSAALGESYTSLAEDASAIYWNPAGLAGVPGYQFAASHQQWFTGITDEVGHAAIPLGPGALGIGLVYSGDRGFEGWTEENEPAGKFSTWSTALSAGYGMTVFDKYQVGATVKGLMEDLGAARGTGGAVDLGFIGHPLTGLGVGFAARHLGAVSYGSVTERLPTEFAVGANYKAAGFTGTIDVAVPLADDPNVRLGVEYAPIKEAALRIGYRTGPTDLGGLGFASGLTGGLGVTVGNFGLDYAFVPYGRLGLTHRVGLRFAPVPPEKPKFGAVALTVIDFETNLPLAAYLTLTGARDTSATTDELRLSGLEPGELRVRAVASGYLPKEDAVRVIAGRELPFVVAMERVKYGTVRGGLFDAGTRERIAGRIVYRGPVLGEEAIKPDPGTYQLRNLPAGDYRVGITGPSEDYIPQSCTLFVIGGQLLERDFYLARKRQTIVLDGVNFETGKADILPQFATVLDRAGEILKGSPTIKVELAGHTDPREINTREFPDNWKLSQARAEAVRVYLIDKFGIAPDRLTARGYADTQPVGPNDTEAGMAKNRRTEFRILE
jgi:outer membrane protein OmpA-like peptidoglycan-associated protein